MTPIEGRVDLPAPDRLAEEGARQAGLAPFGQAPFISSERGRGIRG